MPIKEWIKKLAIYEPGRPIEDVARELGLDEDEIVKLASNENALGPSPKARRAMREAANRMHFYPDGGAHYLRQALANKLHVSMDEIMVGNGSNEILELVAHLYLEKGTEAIMGEQSFIAYRLITRLFEATPRLVPMPDFRLDLEAVLAAVNERTRLIFISNPNNPTGTMVEVRAIADFMARVPPQVAVVMDEAYVELLPPEKQPQTLRYIASNNDYFVLRSFSKSYGLAGLRVGYAIAAPAAIERLHQVRQPFNVNAMALAAAEAALADEAHLERTRKLVETELAYLGRSLERLGLEYVPSVTNFLLVKVGNGREMFHKLQRHGVIVRPVDAYRLPEYVRVTVGRRSENRKFLQALAAVLGK